ncbi:MAG: hypothetical protein QS98_C0003G0083 [archaeon GW2011_AR3]|nr:MAG: hypothetical protein QS98_C0003G0083 [archaeon GW2011_AR3]MBS3110125.1 phosphate uptake regulator PhoU [Candidatus Woesearchaeota archaeon]
MKRKVVLHGSSTLTISLPSAWIKTCHIKKGHELEVTEQGRELIIKNGPISARTKKEIDIGGFERFGKSYITSLYRLGYDEMGLTYASPGYINVIRSLISNEMIGFEITRQENNYCLLQDLTGHSSDEFEIALRRLWLLTLDFASESLDIIKSRNTAELKSMAGQDYPINRFCNYGIRMLARNGSGNHKKIPQYYHLIKVLERIADHYKDMCSVYFANRQRIDDKLVANLAEINECLADFYRLFYSYNEAKMESLFQRTKNMKQDLLMSNSWASFYLYDICSDIRDLLSTVIEIRL